MRSHHIYSQVSLISQDAPTHTRIQLFVNAPVFLGACRGSLTGTPPGTRCACYCHGGQVGPLCTSPPSLVVKFEASFHSRACGSLKLSPNVHVLPWLPPPYLLCLPLLRLQHPPPHYYFRTQLLPLSPKKSVLIKHFIFFHTALSLPPSLLPL